MGLEAVVEDIREKGKKEAEKIRAESKQETDRILAAAGKRVGEIKLAAEAESAKQTAHIIDQEVSAANLLVKREILNTQKALLDKVYETTLLEIAGSLKASIVKPSKNSSPRQKRRSRQGKISCNSRDLAAVKDIISGDPEFAKFKVGNLSILMAGSLWKVKGANCRLITATARSLQRYGNPG